MRTVTSWRIIFVSFHALLRNPAGDFVDYTGIDSLQQYRKQILLIVCIPYVRACT